MMHTSGKNSADGANLRVAERDFKYYIFDWDDNILHMPTRIHLERRREDGTWEPYSVSTALFAIIRNDKANYRPPAGDWGKAFVEFQDLGESSGDDSAFLRDTRHALEPIIAGRQKPGPSFEQFRQALIEGRLFAIVTARGHSSSTLRKGVRFFIDRVLDDSARALMIANLRGYWECFEKQHHVFSDEEMIEHYLDLNRYHAVTSPEFVGRMQNGPAGAHQAEMAKQLAIRDFVEHVMSIVRSKNIQRPVSIGFSDDDQGNVEAAEKYMREELGRLYPGIKFVVYNTSDSTRQPARKVVVQGQLSFDMGDL